METNYIDINFPNIQCKKCQSMDQLAIKKSGRWGIYCKNCGAYIKWASKEQTVIINARTAYIEKQKEVAGLKW